MYYPHSSFRSRRSLDVSFYPSILLFFYPSILLSFYPSILLSFYPSILLFFYSSILLFFYSSILHHATTLIQFHFMESKKIILTLLVVNNIFFLSEDFYCTRNRRFSHLLVLVVLIWFWFCVFDI